MQLAQFLVFFVLIYLVECKNNLKSLTESMGHEVIEIGTPIKDLPPGVEEEPSAETDDEPTTKAHLQPATKRETKRVVTTTTKQKEDSKEDSISQEDEEARIEKELAEIYKDTDYKSDGSETPKDLNVTVPEISKPIARSKVNFKFQPDVNSRQDIERFRTSVDEISCDRRVTQKLSTKNSTSTTTSEAIMILIEIGLVLMSLVVCY